VTFSLGEHGVRAVVLDIEGTTTPIAFVTGTLFPYARAHLRVFLAELPPADAHEILHALARDHRDEVSRGGTPPAWDPAAPATAVSFVEWLMDRDRKTGGLKRLQGRIWARGYADGTLRGEVFADVPPALARWRAGGALIAIYSSGSEQAQRLLFGSTAAGDLTHFIDRFFDTAVGAKTVGASYRRIARELGLAERELLFVSDAGAELRAAAEAGCQVVMAVRPGNAPASDQAAPSIATFDDLVA